MTATFPKMSTAPHHRLCPACGELLVSSRCPECAPIEPARPYSERITQPISGALGAMSMAASTVDVRRATGEWVTGPDDREPQTRRAHPTLVRSALAEAEERALDKIARSALVTHVATTTRPRFGSPTAPRLRPVTPLPPPPEAEHVIESAPVQTSSAVAIESIDLVTALVTPEPAEPLLPEVLAVESLPIEAPIASVHAEPATVTRAPRSPDQFLPTPLPQAPIALADSEPEPETSNRRTTVFWLALLGGAAVLLAIAAI